MFNAIIVEFSASVWTGRMLDRGASGELAEAKKASKRVARVNKDLFADCRELDNVQSIIGQMRITHQRLTLPWHDSGPRLLPVHLYTKYTEQMSALANKAEQAFAEFFAVYTTAINKQAFLMGDLFNAADYPSIDDVRRKFSVSIKYHPLPQSGDFRIDAANELQRSLREQYEADFKTRVDDAMRVAWEQFGEALTHFVDRLDVGADGKPTVFRDSLVYNLKELLGNLSGFNVTGDAQLAQAQQRVLDAVDKLGPEELRRDLVLRETVRADVKAVLRDFW